MEPVRIKHLRSSLGLTQSELAGQLNVTPTTVSLWETGRTSPAPHQRAHLLTLSSQADRVGVQSPPFRPVQYLGSKQKIAPRIRELIEAVSSPSDLVADLFSGSAVVSGVLSERRRTVAVDIQAYAVALAEAMLGSRPDAAKTLRGPAFQGAVRAAEARRLEVYRPMVELDDQAMDAAAAGDGGGLDRLIAFGSVAAHRQCPNPSVPSSFLAALARTVTSATGAGQGVMADYYGGIYFSTRQAIALDALSEVLDGLEVDARRLGRAVLLSVASDLASTVGKQFAQPMRIIKPHGAAQPLLLARALRDRNRDVLTAWDGWLARWDADLVKERLGGFACRDDVLAFVEADTACGAFYADPPYTIDHYSRFYHVLETLILRDCPVLDTQKKRGVERIMRGLYRAGRHQSPFSVPSAVEMAFRRLFAGVARGGRSLVLSYSPFDHGEGHRPRLLTLQEITVLARGVFRRVEVVGAADHRHRKLNAREVNVRGPSDGETLIVCEA